MFGEVGDSLAKAVMIQTAIGRLRRKRPRGALDADMEEFDQPRPADTKQELDKPQV
jgi:hypothetical protein